VTGRAATLAGDGRPFDEVTVERRSAHADVAELDGGDA
jgi:hypothetical protein